MPDDVEAPPPSYGRIRFSMRFWDGALVVMAVIFALRALFVRAEMHPVFGVIGVFWICFAAGIVGKQLLRIPAVETSAEGVTVRPPIAPGRIFVDVRHWQPSRMERRCPFSICPIA